MIAPLLGLLCIVLATSANPPVAANKQQIQLG